jgi:NAD(P)-dependent dehydrogenase (short-subunit alcohol dehydrogenase family)
LRLSLIKVEYQRLSVRSSIMSQSKVWLITGCSRGLGYAFAKAVLDAGHKLVATARDLAAISQFQDRYGDQVRVVALDVTDPSAAEGAIKVAVESFGRLDVLVNNAGYGNIAPAEETTLDDFRHQIETNLFGVIYLTKAALPVMREQAAGHIFQVTSIAARIGPVGRAPYAAAKWGVEGFSETVAKEVGPLGVRVTIVEPGGFRTDFAGSSTKLYAGRPEYDATVGAAARFQQDYNGKQPGDPAKAAAILLRLADMDNPPLRLVLGRSALDVAEKNDLLRLESDRQWRELSVSADFDG